MHFGSIGKKASPKHAGLVSTFVARLDGILPWDTAAVDETTRVRIALASCGTPIGDNDAAIVGHALAAGTVLVTNNVREFERVPGLPYRRLGYARDLTVPVTLNPGTRASRDSLRP